MREKAQEKGIELWWYMVIYKGSSKYFYGKIINASHKCNKSTPGDLKTLLNSNYLML